jgi:hypothetical protein
MNHNILIGVGFWRSIFEPLLPDPAWFVDKEWNVTESQQVIDYLRQGREFRLWMGRSWCRFNCQNTSMGAADLTDGTYCWPEGLAHYLKKHKLRLPEKVVNHILTQDIFPFDHARQVEELCPVDKSWWLTQKGWNNNVTDFSQGSEAADKELLRRFDRKLIDFGPETEEIMIARQQMIEEIRRKRQ